MEYLYFLSGFFFWAIIILMRYLKTGKLKYRFNFSIKNYYLFMSVFLIGMILRAISVHSIKRIYLFLIFALAGVIGEALYAIWWRIFYEKKLWVYKVATLEHGYTSWLNFIPWGLGGILYLRIVGAFPRFSYLKNAYELSMQLLLLFIIGFLIGLALQLAVWFVLSSRKKTAYKFSTVTAWNYLFFCLPFLLGIFLSAFIFGMPVLVFACAFAIFGSGAEYLFGKATQFFISKKLWDYTYLSIDKGHFTPVALVGFSIAGFGFWTLAIIFGLFTK